MDTSCKIIHQKNVLHVEPDGKHLTTEFRCNVKEIKYHDILENFYEIIGPDCQSQNVLSFFTEVKKYI